MRTFGMWRTLCELESEAKTIEADRDTGDDLP